MTVNKIYLNGEEYRIGGDFVDLYTPQTISGQKVFDVVPSSENKPIENDEITNYSYLTNVIENESQLQIDKFVEDNIKGQTNTEFGMLKIQLVGTEMYISSGPWSAYEGDIEIDTSLQIDISGLHTNMNLRTYYNSNGNPNPEEREITFTIKSNTKIGCTDTQLYALNTGQWPSSTTLKIIIESGAYIVGKGGKGGDGSIGYYNPSMTWVNKGEKGGTAIILNHPAIIVNSGTIAGGGGGGGSLIHSDGYNIGTIIHGGGGGQGFNIGEKASIDSSLPSDECNGQDGTLTQGGQGGVKSYGQITIYGGKGGDLGQSGGKAYSDPFFEGYKKTSGGQSGDAIHKNGKQLTISNIGIGEIKGNVQA